MWIETGRTVKRRVLSLPFSSSYLQTVFVESHLAEYMYRNGHIGVSLLVFAPVGYWLVTVGEPEIALLTGALMVWLAMLPDIDHRLPVIEHRGVTHSLVFAVLVGGVFAAIGAVLSGAFSVAGVGLTTFGFLLGFLIVFAHLLGDTLTYAGVNYLWPFSRTFSFSLTRADNTAANYGLLGTGVLVTALWMGMAFGISV